MTCSPARLAANRQNARKSTGSRTPEGKAASRLNATRHGLAGSDSIVGPLDDPGLVAERAEALAEELGATGEAGRLLARRAALLSSRMERLAERDEAATRARMARAVAEADAPRIRVLDRLIAEVYRVGPERALALRTLENGPDGVDRLLGFAEGLVAGLAGGPESAAEARRRAWAWLDAEATVEPIDPETGPTGEARPIIDDAGLLDRIAAEVDRLEDRAVELAPVRAGLARDRRRVALDAAFDPGPEAQQARRYEAAAERGFFRALQAIRQLHREASTDPDADLAPAAPEPAPTPEVTPIPVVAAEPAPTDPGPAAGSLGSFRAEGSTARPAPSEAAPMILPRPPVAAPAHRRHRPDPRKLVGGR